MTASEHRRTKRRRGLLLVLFNQTSGFVVSPSSRRLETLKSTELPEVELWLDLRTTLLDPETAMRMLYTAVKPVVEERGLSRGRAVTGVVCWRDPDAEPLDLDVPVLAVDPVDPDDDLSLLLRAPASTIPGTALLLEEPFDTATAVKALGENDVVLLDGGPSEQKWPTTLELVSLMAAAVRKRLLVCSYDPTQLLECSEALVLSQLNKPPILGGGDVDEETRIESPLPSDGIGVALGPDPTLWSNAILYKS